LLKPLEPTFRLASSGFSELTLADVSNGQHVRRNVGRLKHRRRLRNQSLPWLRGREMTSDKIRGKSKEVIGAGKEKLGDR
jgi:hypothetical protein